MPGVIGSSVASAGDVDGDGFDDVIVGVPLIVAVRPAARLEAVAAVEARQVAMIAANPDALPSTTKLAPENVTTAEMRLE